MPGAALLPVWWQQASWQRLLKGSSCLSCELIGSKHLPVLLLLLLVVVVVVVSWLILLLLMQLLLLPLLPIKCRTAVRLTSSQWRIRGCRYHSCSTVLWCINSCASCFT
jgi:hypothetical protein